MAPFWRDFGRPGGVWALLGGSWMLLGASWRLLGAPEGHFDASLGVLEASGGAGRRQVGLWEGGAPWHVSSAGTAAAVLGGSLE